MRLIGWADGAARGNPGAASWGGFLEDAEAAMAGQALFEGGATLGDATNNEAEYWGAIGVAETALRLGGTGLLLHLDSQLVVKQFTGEYHVKKAHLRPLHARLLGLRSKFSEGFHILHIARELNSRADALANAQLDAARGAMKAEAPQQQQQAHRPRKRHRHAGAGASSVGASDAVDLTADSDEDEDGAQAAGDTMASAMGWTSKVKVKAEPAASPSAGAGKRPRASTGGSPSVVLTGAAGTSGELPHMRPDCSVHRFKADGIVSLGTNRKTCENCYCYVCDKPAKECEQWCKKDKHCHAHAGDEEWYRKRATLKAGRLKHMYPGGAAGGAAARSKPRWEDYRAPNLDAPKVSFDALAPDQHPGGKPLYLRHEMERWLAEQRPSAKLDADQLRVLELVVREQQNVFCTGSGGVGKSFVITLLLDFFKACFGGSFSQRVAVTAPTGIAATHINGTTIHAATGIGVPMYHSDFGRVQGRKMSKIWTQEIEVLILDEVSMAGGEFLDLLDEKLRESVQRRGKGRDKDRPDDMFKDSPIEEIPPFGGIQLVFFGDFLQLPPIVSKVPFATFTTLNKREFEKHRAVTEATITQQRRNPNARGEEIFCNRGYAFQSNVWKNADFITVQLEKIYRQSDQSMISRLQQLRVGSDAGKCEILNYFNQNCRGPRQAVVKADPGGAGGGKLSTDRQLALFAVNKQVDAKNEHELRKLSGRKELNFNSVDWVETFDATSGMVQYDVEENLNKGSHQLGGEGQSGFFSDCLAREKTPLKMTAQVICLYNIDTTSENMLVNGTLGSITRFATREEVENAMQQKIAELQHKVAEMQAEKASETSRKGAFKKFAESVIARLPTWCELNHWSVPVVHFDGRREPIIVMPECFQAEVVGQGACYRMQLPIKVGYAVSIHKSQGMSLARAAIDPSKIFCEGQAYVALSRVTSVQGLELLSDLRAKHIKTPSVPNLFYNLVSALRRHTMRLGMLMPDQKTRLMKLGPAGLMEDVARLVAQIGVGDLEEGEAKIELDEQKKRQVLQTIKLILEKGERLSPVEFVPKAPVEKDTVQHWYSVEPVAKQDSDKCYKCGQKGHWSSKCPGAGGAAAGGGGGFGGMTCFQCGKPGHFSNQCPAKASGGRPAPKATMTLAAPPKRNEGRGGGRGRGGRGDGQGRAGVFNAPSSRQSTLTGGPLTGAAADVFVGSTQLR